MHWVCLIFIDRLFYVNSKTANLSSTPTEVKKKLETKPSIVTNAWSFKPKYVSFFKAQYPYEAISLKDYAKNLSLTNPNFLPDFFFKFWDLFKEKLIQYDCT